VRAEAVVNDCRLVYELAGESGPLLGFVHGLGGEGRTWRDQVPALTAHFRVLTLDLRGHGDSEAPDSAYTFEELAQDLAGVLDHLSVERCHLLGHSFGGVVAARFALDYPDRITKLVVAGSASECNQAAAQAFEARAVTVERQGLASVLTDKNRTSERAFVRCSRTAAGLFQRPLTPELARISCPTLVLAGERDPMGAGGPVIMHRAMPGSRLVLAPERGHYLHREDPEWFNRTILEFLL
jgi:pimeloyl-ACP methyl ester carboxylesterase